MRVQLDISFNWGGQTITNPFMDETGRFDVQPRVHYHLEDEEMEVIYLNGREILLNGDGFREVLMLLEEIKYPKEDK